MEANEAGELQEHAEHGAHEPSMRPVAFTMSVLAVLDKFDAVFAVIADHDSESTKAAVEWAQSHGLADKIAPQLLVAQGLSDEEIDALVAERNLARKQRNFKRSDEIRDELAAKGIVIEDAKDGVRWKRK